jgi:L-methionine (R)-S-oxide reductase
VTVLIVFNTFEQKISSMPFQKLKSQILTLLGTENLSVDHRLTEACELLEKNIPYYDWVGFYFKNGNKEELKLRAFAGEPTDHIIIPFGRGICGQVAISNQNFVVPDVKAQDNYIACSIYVKAEIVIPLFLNGENIGQIDIDSHTADPFSKEDELFLAFVNEEVAKILG